MSEDDADNSRKTRHVSGMGSWMGKFALTIVIAGALSLWTYWRFSSFFNVADGLFDVPFGMRHIITSTCWTVLIATTLCLFERNSWHKSIIKGVVISIVASLVITATFVLLMLIGGMFVDHLLH